MSWIKNLFGRKDLQKELDEAYKALAECNSKLQEKQEHINTTNAYWKKKLHDMKGKENKPKKTKKKDL